MFGLVINPAYKLNWIQQHWTEKEVQDVQKWMLEAVCIFMTIIFHLLIDMIDDIILHSKAL